MAFSLGCVKRSTAPGAPRVVEVRVAERSGLGGGTLDAEALSAKARDTLAKSSGFSVGAGDSNGPRYRLVAEVRVDDASAVDAKKGTLHAFVAAKLIPVAAEPGALSFEQAAAAEGVYDGDKDSAGGRTQARQRHAEHALEDVVRGLGARLKLAYGSSADLNRALDGKDEDLRDEAMRIASERRDRGLTDQVVKLLKESGSDQATRDRAIGTLGAIGDPRAVHPLTEAAQFRDWSELPKVLDARASIGGPEARAYLEFVATGHESDEIREMAKRALEHLQRHAADLGSR